MGTDPTSKATGTRLKRARSLAGYTQAEASKLSSFAQPTISQFESGIRTPDVKVLNTLASTYGTTMAELVPSPDDIDRAAALIAGPKKEA